MSRYQPALLGGLFIGVLSALPVISAANMCCCLWGVAGGVLVTYLLQQRTPTPVATSEAALQGLLAGAIGGAILCVAQVLLLKVTSPLFMDQIRSQLDSNAQLPPEARQFIERLLTGQGLFFIMAFVTIPVGAVFSMAGSFLGLAFFRKKLPPQPQA